MSGVHSGSRQCLTGQAVVPGMLASPSQAVESCFAVKVIVPCVSLWAGCRPGTGTLTITSGPCQPCPTGTYSPGGSMSPCIRCPGSAFMVTPPQATRVNQCTCQPGGGGLTDSG